MARSPLFLFTSINIALSRLQIGEQALELGVFFPQLLEFPGLTRLQSAAFVPPAVERRLSDAKLSTNIRGGSALIEKLHSANDLFYRLPFTLDTQTLPRGKSLSDSPCSWVTCWGTLKIEGPPIVTPFAHNKTVDITISSSKLIEILIHRARREP